MIESLVLFRENISKAKQDITSLRELLSKIDHSIIPSDYREQFRLLENSLKEAEPLLEEVRQRLDTMTQSEVEATLRHLQSLTQDTSEPKEMELLTGAYDHLMAYTQLRSLEASAQTFEQRLNL